MRIMSPSTSVKFCLFVCSFFFGKSCFQWLQNAEEMVHPYTNQMYKVGLTLCQIQWLTVLYCLLIEYQDVTNLHMKL